MCEDPGFCFARHPKARRLQSTTAAAYDMGGPGVNAIHFFWRGSSSRTSLFLFFSGAHVVVVTSPLSRCDQIKSANGRFDSVRFGSLRHRFGSHGSVWRWEPNRVGSGSCGSEPVRFRFLSVAFLTLKLQFCDGNARAQRARTGPEKSTPKIK